MIAHSVFSGKEKIMELIAKNGTIIYRTKLMDLDHAARFARCLGSNSRFEQVTIEQSRRATGERCWFVAFAPANIVRQAAMVERQQTAREERAALQDFDFVLDKDAGRPFCWCHSHTSG